MAFSEVFGLMIEDAVNVMNDLGVDYGELDRITEMSNEDSLHRRSTFKSTKTKLSKDREQRLM